MHADTVNKTTGMEIFVQENQQELIIDSLVRGTFECSATWVISKLTLVIDGWGISS